VNACVARLRRVYNERRKQQRAPGVRRRFGAPSIASPRQSTRAPLASLLLPLTLFTASRASWGAIRVTQCRQRVQTGWYLGCSRLPLYSVLERGTQELRGLGGLTLLIAAACLSLLLASTVEGGVRDVCCGHQSGDGSETPSSRSTGRLDDKERPGTARSVQGESTINTFL
jgi:hypothetical protein